MGYLIAFITSLIFGAYVVPRRFAKSEVFVYQAVASFTVLICGILGILAGVGFREVLMSLPLGILWGLGSIFLMLSIDRIGISRSNQWKNLQGPIGVVAALVLMGELAKANLLVVLGGALLLFFSALAFNIPVGEDQNAIRKNRGGLWLALGSAFLFGLAAAYTKVFAGASSTPSLAFGAGIGFFAVCMVPLFFNQRLSLIKSLGMAEIFLASLAGIIFAASIWAMALTFRYLPVSIGYTIIQLNSLWVLVVGISVFHEIDLKFYWKRVLLGTIFAIAGVVILLF